MVKREKHKVLYLLSLVLCLPQVGWSRTGPQWLSFDWQDEWSWLMLALSLAGLVIWNHLRGVRSKTETLRLEAKVALRTSQIQRDKRTIERQAETLRALDAKKSAFFANISHELRTPLTLMLGPINDVLDRADLQPQDERSLHLAHQHVNKMLTMVNEILDLSKLDAEKLKLEPVFVELRSFSERLLASFVSLAEYRNIELQVENEIEAGTTYKLDADKLERILNNLLSNALKFTTAGGKVTVRIQQLADRLFFEVEDDGIGIAAKDLPFVFDRYYQSDRTEQHQMGGTGIGLALVKELSKLMGGDIQVKSREGEGTLFRLRLPYQEKRHGEIPSVAKTLTRDARQASDFEESPTENLPATSGGRILIVEDHLHMRQYLCEILGTDHSLVSVSNGQEALEHLTKHSTVDLIITDVMMSGVDGFNLLKQLKEHTDWKRIPVIMLTARANQKDRIRALDLGVTDYLLKPFLRAELMARVNNILHSRRQLKQNLKIREPKLRLASTGGACQLKNEDKAWLDQLENTIKAEMGAFDFTIDRLGFQMAISRRQLSRKVKSLTGFTVHQYIQEIKLTEAKRLLETQSKSTVKAIAYELGMKDVKYFSRLYIQRFGQRPSDFF